MTDFEISVNNAFRAETAVIGTMNMTTDLLEIKDANGNILIGNLIAENLRNDGTSDENIVIGHNSLQSSTRARRNIVIGRDALSLGAEVLDTDNLNDNIAIGTQTLQDAVDCIESIAIGDGSQREFISVPDPTVIDRARNVSVGWASLRSNVNGGKNVAIGSGSLNNMGLGGDWTNTDEHVANSGHTAVGFNALSNNRDITATRTIGNTAVGYEAAKNMNSGGGNVAIGYDAANTIRSGNSNVIIGAEAGDLLDSGNNNTIVGAAADVNGAAISNCLILGQGATVNASGQLGIGPAALAVGTGGSGGLANQSIPVYINGGLHYLWLYPDRPS